MTEETNDVFSIELLAEELNPPMMAERATRRLAERWNRPVTRHLALCGRCRNREW